MARHPFQEIIPLLLVLILLCSSYLTDARPHANAVQAEKNPYPNIYPRIAFAEPHKYPVPVPTYSWHYPNVTKTPHPKPTGYY